MPVIALFLLLFALNIAELGDMVFPLWSLCVSILTIYKKDKEPKNNTV